MKRERWRKHFEPNFFLLYAICCLLLYSIEKAYGLTNASSLSLSHIDVYGTLLGQTLT